MVRLLQLLGAPQVHCPELPGALILRCAASRSDACCLVLTVSLTWLTQTSWPTLAALQGASVTLPAATVVTPVCGCVQESDNRAPRSQLPTRSPQLPTRAFSLPPRASQLPPLPTRSDALSPALVALIVPLDHAPSPAVLLAAPSALLVAPSARLAAPAALSGAPAVLLVALPLLGSAALRDWCYSPAQAPYPEY
ncbi:hypothetical protein C8Q80DRAFT_1275646 [Daedaleopsis nitida]|nr:hypothetical protein C8Q80DRAFT_1275646 [Daedaleopsis nitida]